MIQEFDEHGRGYWNCPNLDRRGRSGDDLKIMREFGDVETRIAATKDGANLVSSACSDGFHRPVLDLDIPTSYFPSSTLGHAHLYIHKAITWEKYEALLRALADAGIIEEGYAEAAIRRQASFVRPAWVKKKEETPLPASKPSEDFDINKAIAEAEKQS